MPTDHRAKLATIKRFDQLIAYLRDEMGWPIARDSFEEVDDLFYDFTADELGIDPKTAAKIQEIKRLRPLSPKQPWGIFFVKFEPKKLPVVALRRILSQVALKKRASANSAERAAWAADDLLFVSNYGEGDERQISFAHFSRAKDGHDLPTLKVLGWDNLDTALHLDAVAREMTEHLAWPDDDGNAEAWRTRWRAAFTLRHREVVTTSKELSIRLAELARNIRDRIRAALAIETDKGPLTRLMKAFKEALVHDLDADGFADMYAQTIAYGLLSARIADPRKKTVDDFAAHMRTNPFLRELMETFLKVGGRRGKAGGPGIDFDELGVSEVVELLDDANMEAVVRDFGDRNPQEDPVIHFYELFLKEYDAKKRMQRGVFYTPRPVVSYIVRSVDELLRIEFGLVDGLADTTTWGEMAKRHKELKIPDGVSPDQDFVQILDPATGTGTFLVEVIDLVHKTMVVKWKGMGHGERKIDTLWNEYVPTHLLTRLNGYELLMAPYAIAHLKIGLKLYETGYRFGSDERARIYLTNSLEPASEAKKQMEFKEWIPALAHEAAAVNEIKRHARFTVVVGNPPYSGVSANMGEYAQGLVDAYKLVDGQALNERKHWLQDDYVKFLRLSQMTLDRTRVGVLGFITNHGFLDNPTFRGMRQSLLESFADIYGYDLHGSTKKADLVPDGADDQSVFDIQQGVAVTLAVRAETRGPRHVFHADLWGARSTKYATLQDSQIATTKWVPVIPTSPYYFFVPKNLDFLDEYQTGFQITVAMPAYVNGIVTARDGFVVDFEDEPIKRRLDVFLDRKLTDATVKESLGLSENYAWRVKDARSELRACPDWANRMVSILYRPFDLRRIIYHRSVVWRTRSEVMSHMMAGKNLGLCTNRQVNGEFRHVGATRHIINDCTLSTATKERTYLFPLWLYPDHNSSDLLYEIAPRPNLSPGWLKAVATKLRLEQVGSFGLPLGLTPEDIFHYIYAVLHSPGYRSRYAEFLKIDFPRLPLTGNLELFRALAQLGSELTDLHLLESHKFTQPITEFVGGWKFEIEKISWSRNTVWIDKAQTTGFRGVREEVWNFHIGGYQVCEKWLKDRKGRLLAKDDIAHYQKIVVSLVETIRLMKEIDELIEQRGGWPEAFASGSVATSTGAGKGDYSLPDVIPIRGLAPPLTERDAIEALPLRNAAEPRAPVYKRQPAMPENDEATAPAENLDREELVCQVRQLFLDGSVRDRDTAIRDLARELGYQRTGSRIHEVLDDTIRTAVRRGILENTGGNLGIGAKSIDKYECEFLKDQFLASLGGSVWIEREDAIRAFARWLGFRRTGPAIDETARSLINGLVRAARIESAGTRIRKAR